MIILLAMLITWYATKVYYTKKLKIHVDGLFEHGLVQAKCSRCSQHVIISEDNLRNPYYCVACK
jgi:formamidopyrimidine-DNA glycosylase